LYTNTEGFDISNNIATDLLTKIKSTDTQNIVNPQNSNTEMQIYSWNNQINNIANQSKAIAFYKPNLIINNIQYLKLGDIVSQNTDYSLPSVDQFTLLIKKTTSDFKSPIRFELMAKIDNLNFKPNYYQFSNYVTNSVNITVITNSLNNCASAINNLNALIQNNLNVIQNGFRNKIYGEININNKISVIKFLRQNNKIIESFDNGYNDFIPSPLNTTPDVNNTPSFKSDQGFNNYNETITEGSSIILPAGASGFISVPSIPSISLINISISSRIDSGQDANKLNIVNKLQMLPYGNLNPDAITIFTYQEKLFSYISIKNIINYIISLCNDIQNIYNNQSQSQNQSQSAISYLKLAPDRATIDSIMEKMEGYSNNINTITLQIMYSDLNNLSLPLLVTSSPPPVPTSETTLIELVLYSIFNMNIKYNLSSLTFKQNQLTGISPIEGKKPIYTLLTVTDFNNDIISNISSSMYNVMNNYTFQRPITNSIDTVIKTITSFSQFVLQISNNTIGEFPLQIYKPIAPDNYTTLGHVFCNKTTDLQKIIISNNVACVPSHCVKEIRNWTTNDKIYEYNKNDKYFAIYFNPYTGTFVSTNTNAQQLPEGKVCKVVACVEKCNAVEELEKADDCARKYYNLNKQSVSSTPLSSTLVSNQEEEYYLDKLQTQSNSITRLKQRAQKIQTDVDKSTIVNREMNKSKLQDYVDVQKRNIDIIMKRLQADKNKIKTDINISPDTLNALIQMIKNSSSLSSEQKTTLLTKIANSKNLSGSEYDNNFNKILGSCPQYDLSGLVSKQTASDVCFGCDTPK